MRHPLLIALATVALSCADRVGTTVTTASPRGGMLTSDDGLFSIAIPEGALATEVEVSIVSRDDIVAANLSSRVYEVSPLDVLPGHAVSVRYQAPRQAWIGQRTIATFDEGMSIPADEFERDYDHLDHVATAEYGSLTRRMFGLATIVEDDQFDACSFGCRKSAPGCMIDPAPLTGSDCRIDGWDDLPNSGLMFVINQIAIADAGVGFDVDQRCNAQGECVDNKFAQFGQLANDQIRQGLLGGETLMLVEVSGVDHPGDLVGDAAVAVKFYEGRDFDDPFFPANNFSTPSGETTCCEFLIDADSLEGTRRQARARIQAQLDAGEVHSVAIADTGLWGALPVLGLFGIETSSTTVLYPKGSLRQAQVSLNLEIDRRYNVTGVVDGLIGGMILARELATTPNPYCRTLSNICAQRSPDGALLDLIASVLGQPDLDGDGDGLESFRSGPDGLIVECIDGDGSTIPPVDPARPASCAESRRVADGYSIAYTFEARAAKVKGLYTHP